ncbi:hypothetical protein ACTD5D_21100 [Nocardia takedensis]|uniref:hypothetical protein n=1 Tax=Nocardia takedensis TaxID=259390 RepID=UPI003F76DDCE
MATGIEGPGWCDPGLDVRGGRYPLAVESAVLRMVDVLVPGVSTLTRSARYFSLYWALADYADRHDLDAVGCRELVRRCEVALAWLSMTHGTRSMHGVDRVVSLLAKGNSETMAELGAGSYSPRTWGFWSQYGGPCVTLGAVSVTNRALRPGRVRCPGEVSGLFAALFDLCRAHPVREEDLAELVGLGEDIGPESVDAAWVRDLLLGRSEDARSGKGNAETRWAAFRVLGRCVQLADSGVGARWTEMLRQSVAYGEHLDTDPVLAREPRAQAWRGTLLRHRTVGAWRVLWAELVGTVQKSGAGLRKDDLHEWIRESVPDSTVRQLVDDLPDTIDARGRPARAEDQVESRGGLIGSRLAVLLLGAQRDAELSGAALEAFRGGRRDTKQFLDPRWVRHQRDTHLDRSVGDLACVLVDDMLAQSQRVALRKARLDRSTGQLTMFTKLHRREDVYFTTGGAEGRGNVGLRIEQLGALATQLGVFDLADSGAASVTARGRRELELP